MRWLRGFRRKGERRSLELTPDEQAALLFLLDDGEAAAADVRQVVVVQRGATVERAEEALRGLLAKGLMASGDGDGLAVEARRYRPTKLAHKLRDRIPPGGRSTIEFYL